MIANIDWDLRDMACKQTTAGIDLNWNVCKWALSMMSEGSAYHNHHFESAVFENKSKTETFDK